MHAWRSMSIAALSLMLPALVAGQKEGEFAAQPATSESVAVGVVRHDGLLVPVAHFDGRNWLTLAADRPNGLQTSPWYLWAVGDGQPGERAARAITLEGQVQAQSHCQTVDAVRTSGVADLLQAVRPYTYPVGKLGLAVSTPTVTVTVPVLVRTSDVATSAPQANRAFREAEDVLAATVPVPGRRILPPLAERLEEPVSWRHVYDLGDEAGRGRVYLFEGQVTYSEATITAGQVWLKPDGAQVAHGDIALSGDVQKTGVTRVPLGRVDIAGRSFLFMEAQFYGGEAFEIHEWRSRAPQPVRIFERHGGGC